MIKADKSGSHYRTGKRFLCSLITCVVGFWLVASLFMLPGCGGDSDNQETGQVVIGLTDSEGDFVRYMVTVCSLSLTRANGAVVDVLPLSSQVDFAQYTEMTEFLTAATIPSGIYTKATMRLDYREADIWVEDALGEAQEVESVLSAEGDEITFLEVSVYLEGINSMWIRPGIPAHLTLDFDLNASNRVIFEGGPPSTPTVRVQPVLLAEVNAASSKIHRLRGPLQRVNADGGIFSVIIRPFIHILSGGDNRFGVLQVFPGPDTVYEINGTLYKGPEGLYALESMPPLTAITVMGDLKINQRRFEAREVYAGSSVPGGAQDVITGNVISRTDHEITIRGATLIRKNSSVIFHDTAIVQLGQNTRVTRQLSRDEYQIDDISIGQLVRVFGTLTADPVTQLAMDANSQGHVQLLLTTIKGVVNTADLDLSSMSIELRAIDGRRVGIFNFQGTGLDPNNDADPNAYQVDTGSIDISSLSPGTPVKVRGFVKAFGQAPDDFEAQTIVNIAQIRALMAVEWNPADPNAVSLTNENCTIDLENTGFFHHVGRAGVTIDLTTLPCTPSILPQENGYGLFVIAQEGTRQVYTQFVSFADDLEYRLASGKAVRYLLATGLFDDESASLTAGHVAVKVE